MLQKLKKINNPNSQFKLRIRILFGSKNVVGFIFGFGLPSLDISYDFWLSLIFNINVNLFNPFLYFYAKKYILLLSLEMYSWDFTERTLERIWQKFLHKIWLRRMWKRTLWTYDEGRINFSLHSVWRSDSTKVICLLLFNIWLWDHWIHPLFLRIRGGGRFFPATALLGSFNLYIT